MKTDKTEYIETELGHKTREFIRRSDLAFANGTEKLTSAKLAKKLGLKIEQLNDNLVSNGYVEKKDGKIVLTQKGKEAGGEYKASSKFGSYFLWPTELKF